METQVTNDPVVAIAGVTGAVGAEFIATMDKRAFGVGKLKALASARSAGKTIDFRGQKVMIEELNESSFEGVDIALFSAGGGISRKFTPIAVKAGAVVVDNSSAFRMDPNVPLVIPEINANRIADHKGIIAVPNCAAITFECEKPITEGEVRAILSDAPGVKIVDDRVRNYFPMPIDASGQDDVLVGRIRKDLSDPSGHSISIFAAADQLLKGAALNAIQIAELLP